MTKGAVAAETVDPTVSRAQLHLALSWVSYMSGRVGRSQAEAGAVLAEPGLPDSLYASAAQSRLLAQLASGIEPTIDHPAAPGALLAQAALAWHDGRIESTLELLSAAAPASIRSRADQCYPELALAAVYAALGRFDDARACVLAAADAITFVGDPLWTAAPAMFLARIELACGRLDEALTFATEGLETARALGTSMLDPTGVDVLVAVALARGELEVAARVHRRWPTQSIAARLPFGTPNPHWPALRLREALGARVLGDRATSIAFDLVASDHGLLLNEPAAAAWLVRTARRAGDSARVCDIRSNIERLAAVNSPYETVAASAAHARGVAEGDPELLAEAADGHRWPWARASAAEDCASARAESHDRGGARAWLERAGDEYLECGAIRDHARIRSRLRQLGVRRRHWSRQERPADGWDSLTETERTVAAFVAEGLTNQQVAARMFLSRHTVDFHLRHVFRKLGIESRVVLTRMMLANEDRAS
jgi:DNA-binding CsgD family transcriptional regulator